jgi:hypothetical protein
VNTENFQIINRVPLGVVEPHKQLLTTPHGNKLLYKVMRTEDLIRSIPDSYLHFNQVDTYYDTHDGEQLPKDLTINLKSTFIKARDYSAADYYNQGRTRTFACCFSIENSDYIWRTYGNGGKKGKVCLVFKFGKLRSMLNDIFENNKIVFEYNGTRLRQMFSINYGLIRYINWKEQRANIDFLQNPINYTYFKDKEDFSIEKEFRIGLSAIGIGKIVMNGNEFIFPKHLHMHFDFGPAIGNGVLHKILHFPDCDAEFLHTELKRFNIFKRE